MTGEAVRGFFGEFEFLSNYFPCIVTVDGLTYPSSEHAYQAQKYLDPAVRRSISGLPTPDLAKQYSRANAGVRGDWQTVKIGSMLLVLRAKFFQNAKLRTRLIATYDSILLEDNNWGDRFWGVVSGEGDNNLGILLMRVRRECITLGLKATCTAKPG